MTYIEKLAAIREQMTKQHVAAYIIPSADPHISEYLPDHFKCIPFASGFTGSAGTLVITQDFAGLWTDFRYFEQAEEQLSGSGYALMKLKVQHTPEYIDWLNNNLPDGSVVACNDRLLSVLLGELLTRQFALKNIQLKNFDFLDPIWADRPELPRQPAFLIDEKYTGKSTSYKIAELREELKRQRADFQLISSLDDLAWLFNIRGKDVSFNPVVLSFALITQQTATLFINKEKLSGEEQQKLQHAGVSLAAYEDIDKAIAELPAQGTILIDPKRNCFGLYQLLPKGLNIIQDVNPTTFSKAVKNETEIESMRKTMVKDGVAMTKFLKWIEDHIGQKKITELSAAAVLEQFRAEQEGFVGNSFNTISGYRAHGALPHYSATESSNSTIENEGLFLVDSGGQYHYGTTDITRMIAFEVLTEEEQMDYTLVLKGMIEGSLTKYPKGTCGYQIDAICRKPLWDYRLNYGHGTGHGIGFYLNVHEGPQVFNPTNVAVALVPGMITSIEPGLYRPGKHGIRIENLVLTTVDQESEFGSFYAFETLTLAPIETALIQKDLLENRHIVWLNAYHQTVFDKLSPHLSTEEKEWLKVKTKAI
ncbi:aminopeptidase P family N-terminal domain-containing protein [Pedobacter sp. AW1-32]|uniref:aminopeptidase P family N-terminal domain-containing protein n=1 Tax=Pedobacter sp. AW1-32 TaxID=3383026 RepID=UPI003FEDC53A